MVLIGISIAILNSSLVGFAGMLPPRFMGALMLGFSLNGVLVLGLRVLTLVSFDIMNPVTFFQGAVIYFAIIGGFLVLCSFGIFIIINKNLTIFSLA